jgi:hypothetical protein
MKPSVLRDNKLETDGQQFTSERTALNIAAKDEVNHNYDPMVLPNNKISPYIDAKVVTSRGEEEE